LRIPAQQRRKFEAKWRIAQGGFTSPEHVKWLGAHAKGRAFCGVYVVKDGDIILFRFNV